jgi:ribosomal protein S27AE
MTTEIERDEESSDICTVLLFVGITIVTLIGGTIYYFNLFGWVEIVIVGGGVLLFCCWSMVSDSKEQTNGVTSTHITCPACGKGVIYTYESKDAFGRVACSFCGMIFNPGKYQGRK